jgi:hypothetical protein
MSMKFFTALALAGGLALGASQAQATVFAGNWTLTIGDNSDPGHLKILTSSVGNSFYQDLGAPNPEVGYADLFEIWTNEGAVNPDDLNNTTLTLTFNFTSPGDNDGPIVVGGNSHGYSESFWGLSGYFQGGELIWDNGGVAELQWANNQPNLVDPGRMTLTVSGGRFNEGGLWSTDQGCEWKWRQGKVCTPQNESLGVSAEFAWDNDPTFAAVPEPGTWALMIGGFGLAGATLRRRRAIAA